MHPRIREKLLVLLLISSLGLAGSVLCAHGQELESEVNLSSGRSLGLGLESTGSACCLSIRQWIADTRGMELVIEAVGYLFLTPRSLHKFSDGKLIDGYTGVGLALTFATAPQVSPVNPIRALQVLMGIEVTLPFLPPLAFNLEAALEFQFGRGFTTFLGSGIHFYFGTGIF